MSEPDTQEPRFRPLDFERVEMQSVVRRARDFREHIEQRRSVRDFAADPVPREVIEEVVRAASSAPSGAHRQPWTFVAVGDSETKRQIRIAAEEEEKRSYGGRMPPEWREALVPIGTDWRKPFLEIAPWLVVLFRQDYSVSPDGEKIRHYYVGESVGIAAGFFLAAVHAAGLVSLTHTPSPMGFLSEILGRPKNERAYLLLPVGYPVKGAEVPDLRRKSLEEVLIVRNAVRGGEPPGSSG